MAKKQYDKAHTYYTQALTMDPSRTRIQDVLAQLDDLITNNWTQSDFVADLDSIMQEQAANNPHMQSLHARLSPNWTHVSKLISSYIMTTDNTQKQTLRKDIISHADVAVHICLDMLDYKKEHTE